MNTDGAPLHCSSVAVAKVKTKLRKPTNLVLNKQFRIILVKPCVSQKQGARPARFSAECVWCDDDCVRFAVDAALQDRGTPTGLLLSLSPSHDQAQGSHDHNSCRSGDIAHTTMQSDLRARACASRSNPRRRPLHCRCSSASSHLGTLKWDIRITGCVFASARRPLSQCCSG